MGTGGTIQYLYAISNKMNDQRIIWKRIGAALYDIVIVTIPSGIVAYYLESIKIDFSNYFLIGFLFVECVLPIFTNGRTVGDSIFKIRLVTIEGTAVKTKIFVLRNLAYVLVFAATIGYRDDEVPFISSLISISCIYLTLLSKKNKYSEYLTGLDFVFKTKYIVETSEKPT